MWSHRTLFALVCLASTTPSSATAYEARLRELPNQAAGCRTCHLSSLGGQPGCGIQPCLNSFGADVQAERYPPSGAVPGDPDYRTAVQISRWYETVAPLDSDGDGYSNGYELGDFDGDKIADIALGSGAPSPGFAGDIDECALGFASCPMAQPICEDIRNSPPAGPSFRCVATPSAGRGTSDTAHQHPIDLPDGQWVALDFATATGRAMESACALGSGPHRFLAYRTSCLSEFTRIEARSLDGSVRNVIIGVHDPGDRHLPAPKPELGCGVTPTTLRVPPSGLLRVLGRGSVELRATCLPSTYSGAGSGALPPDFPPPLVTDVSTEENPSCHYAAPVTDRSYVVDLRAGGLTCNPRPNRTDAWMSYISTCTGRVRVRASHGWVGADLYEAGAGISIVAGNCPAEPSTLGCDSDGAVDLRYFGDSRETIEVETLVLHGDRLFIVAFGMGRVHQERVSIECEPSAEPIHCDLCAPSAECELSADGSTVDCVCRPETPIGDGRLESRGGTGCAPPPTACEEAGLTCGEEGVCIDEGDYRVCDCPASCDAPDCLEVSANVCHCRHEVLYCRCPETYQWSAEGCLDIDECAQGNHGCGVGEVCVNTVGGNDCVCESTRMRVFEDEGTSSCQIVCGDSRRGPGEECDDGNTINGDGCDEFCVVEPTFRCFDLGAGSTSFCESTCNDEWIDPDDHLCDENGCSAGGPPADPGALETGSLLAVALLGMLRFRRRQSRRSE
ncbi:MAG: hypothetical protein AAGF12_07800 [Myxococcota bacterium]